MADDACLMHGELCLCLPGVHALHSLCFCALHCTQCACVCCECVFVRVLVFALTKFVLRGKGVRTYTEMRHTLTGAKAEATCVQGSCRQLYTRVYTCLQLPCLHVSTTVTHTHIRRRQRCRNRRGPR
jgi:hypothetical protein